jgi:acyl-CoA thioesterase-1
MNLLVLSFADGTIFFIGLAIVVIADLLLLRFRTGFFRLVYTLFALIGIIFVVISATPLPFWAYALWFLPAAGSLILGNLVRSPRNLRILAGALVLVATTGLVLAEAPYHRSPRIIVPRDKTVFVLGDSLSAGAGTGERCWPAVLEEIGDLSIVNLAEPGARVRSAIEQADRIVIPNSVVIVEIGGNDLLGGTDAGVFRDQLDRLISKLRSNHHEVLMFELPLFPFKNSFGKAQRDIAAKYGVVLLPKRFLTRVLGTEGGTLDGIHLSQKGQNALADVLVHVLQIEDAPSNKAH